MVLYLRTPGTPQKPLRSAAATSKNSHSEGVVRRLTENAGDTPKRSSEWITSFWAGISLERQIQPPVRKETSTTSFHGQSRPPVYPQSGFSMDGSSVISFIPGARNTTAPKPPLAFKRNPISSAAWVESLFSMERRIPASSVPAGGSLTGNEKPSQGFAPEAAAVSKASADFSHFASQATPRISDILG